MEKYISGNSPIFPMFMGACGKGRIMMMNHQVVKNPYIAGNFPYTIRSILRYIIINYYPPTKWAIRSWQIDAVLFICAVKIERKPSRLWFVCSGWEWEYMGLFNGIYSEIISQRLIKFPLPEFDYFDGPWSYCSDKRLWSNSKAPLHKSWQQWNILFWIKSCRKLASWICFEMCWVGKSLCSSCSSSILGLACSFVHNSFLDLPFSSWLASPPDVTCQKKIQHSIKTSNMPEHCEPK